ncbi:HET-domain-containing protein [Hypoxylon cercidicola]|nr:HET-domain-containing protein [Hypoxylon cercidicola]
MDGESQDESGSVVAFGDLMQEILSSAGASTRLIRDGSMTGLVIPIESLAQMSKTRDRRERVYDPVGCSVCEDLAVDRPDRAVWTKRSISEFDAGADQGCKYCLLLGKGIRSCVPPVELTDDDALKDRLARIFPQVQTAQPPNRYGISVFRRVDDAFWENKVIPLCSIPTGDTSSSAALQQAKAWLRDCTEQHDSCDKGEEQEAPSRLIDTQTNEGQDVKLVELDGTTCRYVCLSHCWGRTDSIKTTKGTLPQRKEGIRWDVLCPTFQDVVSIVRQLGLRYLWIDSLCIVQDDNEDWEKESSKMASIYGSAYLTIAATKSPNHDGGCFAEMKPQFQAREVSVTTSGEEKLTLFFRQSLPHCTRLICSPEQAGEFPLLDRGWVFQERLLSPRVLHFQNNELSWECLSESLCECNEPDESIPMAPIRAPFRHAFSLSTRQSPKVDHARVFGKDSPRAIANRWHELVQEYSGLKMTFQKDILPALSGLARHMASLRGNEPYAAGLWSGTIFIDMLWFAEDDQARRPDEWRGPTWSWVSTTSAVKYPEGIMYAITQLYLEVIDSNVRVSTEDVYGRCMLPTWIKVNGTLFANGTMHYAQPGVSEAASAHGDSNYGIHVNGSLLGNFNADYDFKTARGGDETPVPDGSSVELLLVAKTDNNFFYLVLVTLGLAPEYVITHDLEQDEMVPVRARIGFLAVMHHLDTEDPVRRDMAASEEEILMV